VSQAVSARSARASSVGAIWRSSTFDSRSWAAFADWCPPAASGKAAAAPPSSVMKSRRHLVGGCEQRGRHVEAEQPRRLQVDDELEFGRLQDRQVGGLGALEDLTRRPGSSRPIAFTSSGRSVLAPDIRVRNPHAGATHRRRTNLGRAGCAPFFATSWRQRQAAGVALSPLSKSALSPLW
jgi:hypothetical protein